VVSSFFPNEEFEYISFPLEKDGPEPVGKSKILEQIQEAIQEAQKNVVDAHYYISIEGGMEDDGLEMNETAYAVVVNHKGGKGVSSCASFRVPTWVAREVRKGRGFADAVDEFYKTTGTKQGGGFVKILTNGMLEKEEHCMQALMIALASADRSEWYMSLTESI
jgi:non-canonical (house-cleaning) NTP pyrophosphatase